MKISFVLAAIIIMAATCSAVHADVVVNFDDLPTGYNYQLTGTNYAGLTWEYGNTGTYGNTGIWVSANGWSSYPHSGTNLVCNGWGCSRIGITFPTRVDILGAYFAQQGAYLPYPSGVRVHGFRGGQEICVTDWFSQIGPNPAWFAINIADVDRIVIEKQPSDNFACYGMDDLTYTPVPEPSPLFALLAGLVGVGGVKRRRKR